MLSKYFMQLLCISFICAPNFVAQAFELFKVDQEFFKSGLHRDLVTNVTFRIDS